MCQTLYQSVDGIPGHGPVLHVCVSVSFPGHSTSNFDGFKVLHNRIRCLRPPPQDCEHEVNYVQLVQ